MIASLTLTLLYRRIFYIGKGIAMKLMTSAYNWPKTAISSCQQFLPSNHMILNAPRPSPFFFFRNEGLSIINAQQDKKNERRMKSERRGWGRKLNCSVTEPLSEHACPDSVRRPKFSVWNCLMEGLGGGVGAGFFILCSPKTVPSTQKTA